MRLFVSLVATSLLLFVASSNAEQSPVSPSGKRIALTFDDAPRGDGPMFSGDERAERLIAELDTASAGRVAFFIKTKGMLNPAGRARVQLYANAGHLIGNHTHSHNWLHRSETSDYLADIDRAEQMLIGIDNRRPWFRYPYLDEGRLVEQRDATQRALAERELINGYVTVDNYDWYIEEQWRLATIAGKTTNIDALRVVYVEMLTGAVNFYDELAVETLGRSPAHVLLLHENDVAALFIGDLIAALRNAGWEIIDPDVAYADNIAATVPKTLRTGQGRIAGLAIDSGTDPRTLSHYAIEESQIDARLLEVGVFDE